MKMFVPLATIYKVTEMLKQRYLACDFYAKDYAADTSAYDHLQDL